MKIKLVANIFYWNSSRFRSFPVSKITLVHTGREYIKPSQYDAGSHPVRGAADVNHMLWLILSISPVTSKLYAPAGIIKCNVLRCVQIWVMPRDWGQTRSHIRAIFILIYCLELFCTHGSTTTLKGGGEGGESGSIITPPHYALIVLADFSSTVRLIFVLAPQYTFASCTSVIPGFF